MASGLRFLPDDAPPPQPISFSAWAFLRREDDSPSSHPLVTVTAARQPIGGLLSLTAQSFGCRLMKRMMKETENRENSPDQSGGAFASPQSISGGSELAATSSTSSQTGNHMSRPRFSACWCRTAENTTLRVEASTSDLCLCWNLQQPSPGGQSQPEVRWTDGRRTGVTTNTRPRQKTERKLIPRTPPAPARILGPTLPGGADPEVHPILCWNLPSILPRGEQEPRGPTRNHVHALMSDA